MPQLPDAHGPKLQFTANYQAARDRFRRAAEALKVQLAVFPISARGPRGEELAIDVAAVGAGEAERVVVISSGLHGVEGSFGSAIQSAWLEEFRRSRAQLPEGVRAVLLHVLNPFGFAWRRRANENNVDLNRNFLQRSDSFSGATSEYRELSRWINPGTPPPRFSWFIPQATLWILRYGMENLKAALTQGQYEFPDGLFFGGRRAEESTVIVQTHFASWVGPASHVLHLDFHSGLGRFAQCKLLSVEPADSPRGRWLAARFGQGGVEPIGAGIAARTTRRGSMGFWLRSHCAEIGRTYAFLSPEFGTYSGLRVFGALRDENRVQPYPEHRAYEKIKAHLVEVFCPASLHWREAVLTQGVAVIQQAIDVCQDESWQTSEPRCANDTSSIQW